MMISPVDRLSRRQRTCLALTADLLSAKDIARKLDIKEGTVEGYIADAVRVLGAKNKRDAARIFVAHEASKAPRKTTGESSRVSEQLLFPPTPLTEVERSSTDAALQTVLVSQAPAEPVERRGGFHVFRGERRNNDLTYTQRIVWIAGAALVAAALFLISVNVIDALARALATFQNSF